MALPNRKNLYFEWLKKSKRTIPIDDSLATYDSGYDIAEAFADKDIANQILKYLHELEEPYKEVFMLHALGDIPLTRISQLLVKVIAGLESHTTAQRP